MSTAEHNAKDFTVAIIGGGICGLACAIALTQAGVPVQIFEAASKFEEIGAGISLGPNALRPLTSLGVLDAIFAKGVDLNFGPMLFVSAMEGHEIIYDYAHSSEELGLGIHRAVALDAMIDLVDPKITHFKKRCTSVSVSPGSPSRTVVHFADGTDFVADVVIGADGIKSVVRGVVAEDGLDRVAFTNTVAYRGLVPSEMATAAGVKLDRPHCIMGKDKHIITFPVRRGDAVEVINIVAFAANNDIPIGSTSLPAGESWAIPVSRAELLKEFEGWASDVIALLQCIEAPSKWSIHAVSPPLRSYVKRSVALIGDAAHAMLPHLGSGAGTGIEDAFLITQLLGHPQTTVSNIEAVLQIYDRIRRPRAQMVWEGSRKAGQVYEGRGPHGDTTEGKREDLVGQWGPVYDHILNDDIVTAVSWLKDAGVFVGSD